MKKLQGFLQLISRGFFVLLGFLLCLPVILLPAATGVPAFIWTFLLGGCMASLVLQLWIKPAWVGTPVSILGVLLVSGLAVAASQNFAATPLITDVDGNALPNAIASLEKVSLNGSEQWVSIRGRDLNLPVLLFLAGDQAEANS